MANTRSQSSSYLLFDVTVVIMIGNVREWVEDDRHDTYDGALSDGSAWVDKSRGSYRVIRDGSCCSGARRMRWPYRFFSSTGNHGGDVGFRLSRSVALIT
jgi:formylglycine-generating enzyme required for sulfatase activity